MVCHIGVKAITPLFVDQAQLISVDHECRLCPVPATEKGETVMPSCDEGTMQTGGHCAGTDYDVQGWRHRSGDEYVRRKKSSHGQCAGIVLRGTMLSTRALPTVAHESLYCVSNSSYIN